MSTKQFREQHVELLNIVKQIAPLLNIEGIETESEKLLLLLEMLLKDLTIHLTLEDKIFYPKMMRSPDRTMANTAKQYQIEMGGLVEEVSNLKVKWNTASKICTNPSTFIKEVENIFSALEERIILEDMILYPMFERILFTG